MRCAARSLPFSMKALVETELRRLLDENIIYAVENPTMSAPIVPVVKQAGAIRPIRICGDYSQTLNKIIDSDQYKIPKMEEILEKLPGAQVYSVLDLQDAYLQVSLSEESQHLTCISTHLGHFAFRKLQFGISAAPLIFQEIMEKILQGIKNVAVFQDDTVIGAPNDEVHDETVLEVRRRLQQYGFKINDKKSQCKLKSVKFLGFILSNGKMLPDPDRLKAFKEMPVPTNKEQLKSALCSLRHYGVFCKDFSAIARPLYALLRKDAHWNWSTECEKSFKMLLAVIPNGEITCYDLNKPLFVTSDASKDGLGFVLSHDLEQKQIVWLGSRVLSQAEANYSNIEREALSVVEAVKYFH